MVMSSLTIPRLSKLKNATFVEGLTINLISVNELCDKDLFIKFTST